jgi:hypothetical protein
MKVLKEILVTLLAVFIVAALLLTVRLIQDRQYRDALDEMMQKKSVYYSDISEIPYSSIAQELYYVSETNSTVDFNAYYEALSGYKRSKLPEFYNPTNMLLEYIDGKWNGDSNSKNHTLVFDDGSVLEAKMFSDTILQIRYYDGMIYLPEHEYYTSSSDHSYVLYVLPDGTRLGGQHQSALFDIEDDMFSGAEGFEYDKIYVVSYPNRVDVFPNGFMFNQTQSWAAFRNGVFVFAVKADNEYQLWRIVRGSAEMIDSSNEPITLSRSGISDNNDGIFAQVGNKEYCFTRNAGFTVTEK